MTVEELHADDAVLRVDERGGQIELLLPARPALASCGHRDRGEGASSLTRPGRPSASHFSLVAAKKSRNRGDSLVRERVVGLEREEAAHGALRLVLSVQRDVVEREQPIDVELLRLGVVRANERGGERLDRLLVLLVIEQRAAPLDQICWRGGRGERRNGGAEPGRVHRYEQGERGEPALGPGMHRFAA